MAKKLEEMSDAELENLLSQESKSSEKSLDQMSDEELQALVDAEEVPQKQSLGRKSLDYLSGGAQVLGSIFDYPVAPVREFLGSSVEVLTGKKTPSQLVESVSEPIFKGPSKSRSYTEILESLGVPKEGGPAVPLGVEEVMLPEERQAAPKFQTSAVGGSFLEQATPAAIGKLTSKIPIPSLIDKEKQTARAIGLSPKQISQGMTAGPESTRRLENITNFATESGIVKPLSSREKIFYRAKNKMEEAGKKIGDIIQSSDKDVENWISNATPELVEKYLNSGFNIPKQKAKMMMELSDELEGGANHDSALRTLGKWLDRHEVKSYGRPSIEQMQKWKGNVSKSISDFSKAQNEQPAKAAAYRKILEYLDKGLESEVNFAENYLKSGQKLDEYLKAKKDYSMSKQIHDSTLSLLSKEKASGGGRITGVLDTAKEMIYGAPVQSTLGSMKSPSIGYSPLINQIRSGYKSTQQQNISDVISNSIEESMKAGIPPYMIDEEIKKSNMLKPTEKAKLRKNLVK